VVAFFAGPAAPLHAQGPPHWAGTGIDIDCTSQCHVPHQSPGGALNSSASNVNLCQSCHAAGQLAADLTIDNVDKADPGVSGVHHAFDVAAVNATLNTQLPQDAERVLRVMANNVVCSTCHDQHRAEQVEGGRSRVGNARIVNVTGGGGLIPGGTYNGAEGAWYLIEIVTGGGMGAAQYAYSKDNGATWFPGVCSPSTPATCPVTSASAALLDSGVTVAFTGTGFVDGDQWEFAAAWAYLRWASDPAVADERIDSGVIATGDRFCRDCHRAWVMTHDDDLVGGGGVENWDGNPKSHPVGVGLNANGAGYDRAAPLDGNGDPQGGGGDDANPTNDLLFDAGGLVQCLTCHGVHYVDSNTQTVDGN
jgi:predicted CXXCH cytochrome family protein